MRPILAVLIGLIVGTAVWIVAEILIHGTCGILADSMEARRDQHLKDLKPTAKSNRRITRATK